MEAGDERDNLGNETGLHRTVGKLKGTNENRFTLCGICQTENFHNFSFERR